MNNINKIYLSYLSAKYDIKEDDFLGNDFESFRILKERKQIACLALCNNYAIERDVNSALERISALEEHGKKGNSYLLIIPKKNPTLELCTHFNGKSFVHIIFYDKDTNSLTYDKRIYYLGVKSIKRLIDAFQFCFDSIKKLSY